MSVPAHCPHRVLEHLGHNEGVACTECGCRWLRRRFWRGNACYSRLILQAPGSTPEVNNPATLRLVARRE